MAFVATLLVLAGCATERIDGDARLIDPYSPKREAALFTQPLPLLALYRRSGRRLGFVAVTHSSDPASATFRLIGQSFDIVRPTTVILEGFPTAWGANPASVIGKLDGNAGADSYSMGEDAHAAKLARAAGATIWGGEPTDAELAQALGKEGFDPTDIFFASMFGPLAQEHEAGMFSGPDDPRFGEVYRKLADQIAPAYGDALPRDVATFETWFATQYAMPLNRDPQWFVRGGPGQAGKAGDIGRASNVFRDKHMFLTAIRLLNEHRRVLIIYGGSHLSSQWRAFATALGRPDIIAPGTATPSRTPR